MCSNHSHTISIRRIKQQLLLYTTQLYVQYILYLWIPFTTREFFSCYFLRICLSYAMPIIVIVVVIFLLLIMARRHHIFTILFLFHFSRFLFTIIIFLFFSFVVVCMSLHASCFSPYILYESAKERSSQNYIRRYVMYSPYSVSVFGVYI